jgi:hypothetical protein
LENIETPTLKNQLEHHPSSCGHDFRSGSIRRAGRGGGNAARFLPTNEIVTILPPPCGYCKLMKFKLLRFGIFIAPKVS